MGTRLNRLSEAVLTSTHNLCFEAKIRKKLYPCKPQFYYIKVGCKGVFVTRTCFHDASKGIKTLIIAFVSKTGQLVAHYRHRIFSFGVLYQIPNIFRHFTGLTTLRERPFDIYTGQEDVLGLVILLSRHNPVFLFLCNTLLILPKDNTKRTISFNLSMMFFSEKKDRST